MDLSIILPAKNEAESLAALLPDLKSRFPDAEIIVVNDGSDDNTREICDKNNVITINNPYSMGNGAAIKSGARKATGGTLLFMDADGQHEPKEIQPMLELLSQGYDMVVGSRTMDSHASIFRRIANGLYNYLASWMTGFRIKDLTSGFRAVNAEKFRRFTYLLPNGFSYPTTITMAFFRSAYPVAYHSIVAKKRTGKSKINLLKDGIRFFIIILKVGALFSPMRFFLPISLFFFITAVIYYAYTYIYYGRFTNMSALLFLTSVFIFLIGIMAEQISSLHYQRTGR